jgi:hypothetical protein
VFQKERIAKHKEQTNQDKDKKTFRRGRRREPSSSDRPHKTTIAGLFISFENRLVTQVEREDPWGASTPSSQSHSFGIVKSNQRK